MADFLSAQNAEKPLNPALLQLDGARMSSLTASYRSLREEISFPLGEVRHAEGNSIKLQDEIAAFLTPVNFVH